MAMAVNPQIAIVALMGLPASGKTTLSKQIVSRITENPACQHTRVIVLSYDDFIPLQVQIYCAATPTSGDGLPPAKILRNKFLQAVEILVSHFVQMKTFENIEHDVASLFGDSEFQNLHIFVKNWIVSLQLTNFDYNVFKNILLVIDDNNYYHSMRNDLYQIGKKYKTGFCVLFQNTSVTECISRNVGRAAEFSVPNYVIEEMGKRLEEPDPMKNSCDMLSFQVSDASDDSSFALIQGVFEYALQHPIDVEPPADRREQIETDRRICSENEIHQADQVLRKWVHTEVMVARFAKEKNEMKKFSEELSTRKANVLSGLKSGNLSIVSTLHDPVAFQKEIVALARQISLEKEMALLNI